MSDLVPKKGRGIYQRGARIPKPRKQITVKITQDLLDFAEHEAYIRSSRPPYRTYTLSDIVRIALAHLKKTAASKAPEVKKPCAPVIAAEMAFCATCGIRWDNESPVPPCPREMKND